MNDYQAPAKPSLTDAELATHPTVFAADACCRPLARPFPITDLATEVIIR
jgi:hypothetical protein